VKKYFSKIFAVYILILALTPCLDNCSSGICFTDDEVHIESSGEDSHSDICTPLCVCLCCNNVISVQDNFDLLHFRNQSKLDHTENINFSFHFSDSSSPPPKS
jgi:hypothetical protein